MILPRNRGSVADWHFHGPAVFELSSSTFIGHWANIAAVISILKAEQLLQPNTARLFRWMQTGSHPVAEGKRVDKPILDLPIAEPASSQSILSSCLSIIEGEAIYPLTVEISGSGLVLMPTGGSLVDDLVWLNATTLDTFMISIATQSDVWLPFSLQGVSQSQIQTLNANRLSRALQQIHLEIGFELEQGTENLYSVVDGFRMDNIRYADGSVADVS